MFILCDFPLYFILITSFSSLKYQRTFFLHSLHLFFRRSLAPLFTSTFSFTMLQFLLPDIFLSPPPPSPTPPSCVLNTYFHSILEICIQGPSSCSDILNLLQSRPGICHCSLTSTNLSLLMAGALASCHSHRGKSNSDFYCWQPSFFSSHVFLLL